MNNDWTLDLTNKTIFDEFNSTTKQFMYTQSLPSKFSVLISSYPNATTTKYFMLNNFANCFCLDSTQFFAFNKQNLDFYLIHSFLLLFYFTKISDTKENASQQSRASQRTGMCLGFVLHCKTERDKFWRTLLQCRTKRRYDVDVKAVKGFSR